MGRREKPIDRLQPFAEFANGLRVLRAAAGRPGLRAVADEIDYSLGYVSDALSGKTLPTWEFTSAFVRLCGGEQKEWLVRWQQAKAAKEIGGGAIPAPGLNDRTRPGRALHVGGQVGPVEIDGARRAHPVDPDTIQHPAELSRGLNQLRGGRSYAQLGRGVGGGRFSTPLLPASTLSDMLSGKTVPSEATMMAFLDAVDVPDAEGQRWLAARERVSTAHLRRPEGAVRVREADPRLLGVHASIDVDPTVKGLSTYVARDVDAPLRASLTAARDRGGFFVVIGSSSSGKTRTLLEAIRSVAPEWWLVHPADAAAVRAIAASPAPRTVVWMDDLQRYFTQPGGVPAGTIRALLAAKALVVGTLWPEEFAARTTRPAVGAVDQYAEDRAVLAMAQSIQITPTLSLTEQNRAKEAAREDQRIRIALESTDASLTQVLAAGPDLISWWENASSDRPESTYGKAIITAALDARRVGAVAAVTREFLVAAAPAYLSNASRAAATPNWFDQAIRYATTQLRSAMSCLTPVAASMGTVDGWLTADFLFQHAHRVRRTLPVPDEVWRSLIDHHRPEDTYRLAVNAERRGRRSDGQRLWDRAAQQAGADEGLVETMARQGRINDLRDLADTGDRAATSRLAELLVQLGRVDEAIDTLHRAANTGDGEAASGLAELLVELGRNDEAIAALRLSADTGSSQNAARLADLLADQGRLAELRQRADAGDSRAAVRLIQLLIRHGNMPEAIELVRQSTTDGGAQLLQLLTEMLGDIEQHGLPGGTLEWHLTGFLDQRKVTAAALRLQADAGDRHALTRLAELLTDQGRDEEAIELLRERADAGDVHAAIRLISLLAEHHRVQELRDEVQAGTPYAYHMLQTLDTKPTSDAPRPDRRVGSGRPA